MFRPLYFRKSLYFVLVHHIKSKMSTLKFVVWHNRVVKELKCCEDFWKAYLIVFLSVIFSLLEQKYFQFGVIIPNFEIDLSASGGEYLSGKLSHH